MTADQPAPKLTLSDPDSRAYLDSVFAPLATADVDTYDLTEAYIDCWHEVDGAPAIIDIAVVVELEEADDERYGRGDHQRIIVQLTDGRYVSYGMSPGCYDGCSMCSIPSFAIADRREDLPPADTIVAFTRRDRDRYIG